jgi:cation diffusion facilitator family transporter
MDDHSHNFPTQSKLPPEASAVRHQTEIAAWLSLAISIIVLALKVTGYFWTHSQAVLSDALESIVNVITALIALWVMRAVSRPADEDHPYGHGKLEYFSSAFEGGMIAFAAVIIGLEAVKALLVGEKLNELESGMVIVAAAGILNLLLGLHLKKVGQKHNSEALTASGAHVISDVVTTGGVVVGLIAVKISGWVWLDPIFAIGVALFLLKSGYSIVRKAAGGLIDEVDVQALGNLVEALNANKQTGLIDVHDTRIIRSGRFHHVDAHLVVPSFWDAEKVHEESQDYEEKVVQSYKFEGEFAFHVDPCRRFYCSICDVQDCQIRAKPFQGLRKMTVESIVKETIQD